MHLQVATSGEAVGGSRYRTLGRLGSGGMADLDLAVQSSVAGSSRLCVLKRVRKDLAGRPDFVRMFFEEARISASLGHPNIVQVYEVGGDEQDCFLAMEFLRGRSYAHLQRIAAGKPHAFRVDLEVLLATLSGLEHAHERCDLSGVPMQLIHRDISPPNVFVTYDGEVKLLDFGVAKAADSLVKTEAGMLKGKVAYMAPEMVAGKAFDARVDLYAVGVMLWEAVAGHDRWPGMNDVAILAQLVREQAPEAPGATARGLPALADRISLKALAPDPRDRYQSASEMRADLQKLCEQMGGRLGQAEIREHMERHFANDRRREQREIDAALREQRITPGGALVNDAEVSGFTKRVKRPSVEQETPTAAPLPPTPLKTRGGRIWVAAAGSALALAVGLKLWASAGTTSVSSAAPSASQTPLVPTIVAESPASAAPAPPPEAAPTPLVAAPKQSKPRTTKSVKPAATPKASPKPASPKGLQLDRQDPWQ